MEFDATPLPGVVVVRPRVFEDDRGFFMETWRANSFADAGIDLNFVQENFSRSVHGTLRGLHYQIQQPQGKLVRVVLGEVFDVAVDIRRSSPKFGHWFGVTLSDQNRKALWVPPGFAHGFLVLSDTAEFEYKCTDYYAPEYERSLRWDDPDIGIDWPIGQSETPILSAKDEGGIALKDAEVYP
jgi:dTDP-4-dehydrorhamnose 3,5-epimerase